MQSQNPCFIHEAEPLAHVCLEKDCALPRFYCSKCISNHDGHNKIAFTNYKKVYQNFEQLSRKTFLSIKNSFKLAYQVFEDAMKNSEEKILSEFCGNFKPESFPPLNKVEIQQLYGIADSVIGNPIMEKMLKGVTSHTIEIQIEEHLKKMTKQLLNLEEQINCLLEDFSVQSQYYMSQLKISKSIYDEGPSNFTFSDLLKNQYFTISGGGSIVTRTSPQGHGLSAYCLTQQSLTKENPSVTFKIINQKHRFMYIGVCCIDKFFENNFMGPVYEKGMKMYAIRQNKIPGTSAFSLHNSIDAYANQQIVGWDFQMGDIIKLTYDTTQNTLTFTCNDTKQFMMPLDDNVKQIGPFPFVGMKFEGQKIGIIGDKAGASIKPLFY